MLTAMQRLRFLNGLMTTSPMTIRSGLWMPSLMHEILLRWASSGCSPLPRAVLPIILAIFLSATSRGMCSGYVLAAAWNKNHTATSNSCGS